MKEKKSTGTFDIRAFYTRRALKIVPPLLVIVIVPSLAFGFFGGIEWKPLLGIVFFFYNWLRVDGISPQLVGSGVVWSLSIEEQFYLVFALIWFAALSFRVSMKRIVFGILATALLSLGMRIVLVSTHLPQAVVEDRIYYASDTRIEAIALGVLTAIAFHYSLDGLRRNSCLTASVRVCQTDLALLLAVAAFLASLVLRNEWFRYTFRFSIQALAACAVIIYGFGSGNTVIGRAFNAIARMRIVQFIGLSSYSIYLAHLIVMSYALPIVRDAGPLVKIPALTLLGTIAGFGVYLAVERPIQLWRHRTRAEGAG